MRLKHIKGAEEAVANSIHVISLTPEIKDHIPDVFPKKQPLYIEIGMGKGQFIMEQAKRHPEINYIGMEMYSSVCLRAIQKMDSLEEALPNLKFICDDATILPGFVEKGQLDKIYLNFSDPWPKDRHAKRRLTSKQFLDRYDRMLSDDGNLEFKTDNVDLFNFSLKEVEESKWILDASTFDLHNDPVLNEGNIMTEYEQKFSEKGNPICKMIIHR